MMNSFDAKRHGVPCFSLNLSRLWVLTHQKPLRRFCMLFFDVLPFTTHAVSVSGKTSKKNVQKRRGVFGASRPLTMPHPFLSVNRKTSKKSMTRRGEMTQYTMLFFEFLLFTDKKKHAMVLGVSRPLGS